MFISFEGVDYSGKSTQAQLLVKRFQKAGKEALFLREPGGTAVSEKIRTILLEKSRIDIAQKTELFLFSAARCQLVNEVILKALKSGKAIVCVSHYLRENHATRTAGSRITGYSLEAATLGFRFEPPCDHSQIVG